MEDLKKYIKQLEKKASELEDRIKALEKLNRGRIPIS